MSALPSNGYSPALSAVENRHFIAAGFNESPERARLPIGLALSVLDMNEPVDDFDGRHVSDELRNHKRLPSTRSPDRKGSMAARVLLATQEYGKSRVSKGFSVTETTTCAPSLRCVVTEVSAVPDRGLTA